MASAGAACGMFGLNMMQNNQIQSQNNQIRELEQSNRSKDKRIRELEDELKAQKVGIVQQVTSFFKKQ
jgi:hypothetical protein